MGLTREELAEALNELSPTEPLGTALHSACIRLSPSIAIEAVMIKEGRDGLSVLLRQRSQDEPSYPGQYHCPGCYIRHGENVSDALRRLTDREGIGTVLGYELADNHFWMEERGWICSAIYVVRVKENADPALSRWYKVTALPRPMVEEHELVIIPAALQRFKRQH